MKNTIIPIVGMMLMLAAFVACEKENKVDIDPDQVVVDPTETGDSVLLHASFDEAIPATWTNIDQDGDGNKWRLFSDDFPYTGLGFCGTDCLASCSEYPLKPDNLIVSPQFHIPGSGGYTLSFWYSALNANKFRETYTVYVGKMKDGAFVPIGTLLEETTDDCVLHQHTISLDQYKGYDLRIAFRHHNTTTMSYLLIDEVNVTLTK